MENWKRKSRRTRIAVADVCKIFFCFTSTKDFSGEGGRATIRIDGEKSVEHTPNLLPTTGQAIVVGRGGEKCAEKNTNTH
jgi:hypothetical protein